jgi:hypothetical protein
VDLLAAKFASITPMHFGYNNPIMFNDPTGLISQGVMNMIQNAWDKTGANEARFFDKGQGDGAKTAIYDIEGQQLNQETSRDANRVFGCLLSAV